MDLNLANVHILVTGASGGIGLETVKLFLDYGATITAQYTTNSVPIEALLQQHGSERIIPVQADLRNENQVKKLFDSHRPVQIAVINHGIWPNTDVPLKDMSLDQWQNTINTNLTSSFLVARDYLRNLETLGAEDKKFASIIFVGSTAGKFGEANHADYAASKSALMYGLTSTLKNEIVKIAPKGRVNCVAPGWVKTPMAERALQDPEVVYRSLATTPLCKVALPRDVAMQILALTSPTLSGHITGQVIMVDGGMEGRLLNQPRDIKGPGV